MYKVIAFHYFKRWEKSSWILKTGLTWAEAIEYGDSHNWKFIDDFGVRWDLDIVEDDNIVLYGGGSYDD